MRKGGDNIMDIDDILKMLDWNNDLETQQKGRCIAKRIKCLGIFVQPMDKQFNKNIWENCAMILSEKEDELLTPYIFQLLDWLQDLNWPGSIIILERLQEYRNYYKLTRAIENRIVVANALGEKSWLANLAELITCDEIKQKLSKQVYKIIEAYL